MALTPPPDSLAHCGRRGKEMKVRLPRWVSAGGKPTRQPHEKRPFLSPRDGRGSAKQRRCGCQPNCRPAVWLASASNNSFIPSSTAVGEGVGGVRASSKWQWRHSPARANLSRLSDSLAEEVERSGGCS